MTESTERNIRHKRAMQRKKAHIDGRIAQATVDKGLLLVLTGNGKGKSSSRLRHVSAQCGPWSALRRSAVHQGPVGSAASTSCSRATRWWSFM